MQQATSDRARSGGEGHDCQCPSALPTVSGQSVAPLFSSPHLEENSPFRIRARTRERLVSAAAAATVAATASVAIGMAAKAQLASSNATVPSSGVVEFPTALSFPLRAALATAFGMYVVWSQIWFGMANGLDGLDELSIADRSENLTRPTHEKQAG